MAGITYFVPGEPAEPVYPSPLQIYLPKMPAGVAAAYIEAMTRPGDLVLDPFCQTPQVIREGLALGRRVLASNLNPVVILAVELSLAWEGEADRRAITTAFTHLADSLVMGDETLRARLAAHYATRCPTCRKPAQAEAFVWDRDRGAPLEKRVRCTQCGAESRGEVDEDDLARLKRYPLRGLPYWLLLDRVAPPGPERSDERERAAAVLATYTPRALTAISDVLIRLDALPEAECVLLRPVFLETLAECSALHPPADDERARPVRPRSLKVPPRFVEPNVWSVMEKSLNRLAGRPARPALPRVAGVSELLARREPAACLVAHPSRDIAGRIEPGSVALIAGLPPEPDPTFWALSAVWSAIVWGEPAADAVRPLLDRRRADKEWLWRGVATALGALAPALAETGRVVLVHPAADDEWLGGLALAGASAGLALEHALAEPQAGLRVAWQRAAPTPSERQLDVEALGMEVMEVAEQAALDVMRARGEPAAWIQLAANIYQALARTDLLRIIARLPEAGAPPLALLTHLVRGTFEGRETAIRRVEGHDHVWWLNRSLARMGLPLCDLVEMAVYDALLRAGELDEAALVADIYRRFPGLLTPDRALVAMCLESYSRRAQPGVCALREQDRVESRRREIAALRETLIQLGERLGWSVTASEHGRLVWAERRSAVYTFSFSATAELAPYLLARYPPPGTPVLVIPGGRAGLIEYKLRRNAPFHDAAAGAGWQFLKFRHLRTLADDPQLSRASFQAALGLDPLIESERQMPLL